LEAKEDNEMNEKCHGLLSDVFIHFKVILIKAMKSLIRTSNNGEWTKVPT